MPHHSASSLLDRVRIEFKVDDLDKPLSLFETAGIQPPAQDLRTAESEKERKVIEEQAALLGIIG